ncbi:capon-like protein isoform X2 [Orussus abietinus]|uniref:capon-like protein isoform X2 n=1 Tax=Orussus abietinus TaxID=222816 RepID=UPI0006269242|nr:capon-like protein isoform X2 [Orussus abietinus]
MPRGLGKQNSTELPSPGTPGGSSSPGSPGPEVVKPRKKLSFKEPEFFGKLKRPFSRNKPPLAHSLSTPADLSFDENPLEEENVDLEELESQAMRVVRTVGQAFEVCHKLSLNTPSEERQEREREGVDHQRHREDYEDQDEVATEQPQPSPSSLHKDISLLADGEDPVERTSVPCLLRTHEVPATMAMSTTPIRRSPSGTATSDCAGLLAGGELTALKHEIQLLRERLDQQGQQTRAAVAHARLLQDQLAAETAARIEAQARTHQLLVQNKELLEHISALVGHLREQERVGGPLQGLSSQSQVSGGTAVPQTPTGPDLSTLGQSQRTGGQNSPWELDPPPFAFCPYPADSVYLGHPGGIVNANSTDQLHFQAQLMERLHNISPYQTHRSPYTTPSPYPMGPSLLLPPSSRPSNSSQLSPGSVSLRVSQANSFSSSPVMPHRIEAYLGGEQPDETQQPFFIKPLPCQNPPVVSSYGTLERTKKMTGKTVRDDLPPIVLDPPPPRKRAEVEKETVVENPKTLEPPKQLAPQDRKHLATILRAPGPPPSRTTSARLPARNDLMCQVQRTTWARHTTK